MSRTGEAQDVPSRSKHHSDARQQYPAQRGTGISDGLHRGRRLDVVRRLVGVTWAAVTILVQPAEVSVGVEPRPCRLELDTGSGA
jgi:hypothetical protein